ncbi:hypothetical protein [Oceanobacillus oncorhynchi]|uniref:hypothetical protein n=1 Tax=Oceanobacillus oncorhynchi TaxID=545501 RepID=UPI0034D7B01E
MKQRAESFLQELTELSRKYGLRVTSEGGDLLLYSREDDEWIEFGRSFFTSEYKIYED